MVERIVVKNIIQQMFKGKAIILEGPRRIGKSTLFGKILSSKYKKKKIVKFNCDNPIERELLENKNLAQLEGVIGRAEIVLFDEGQKVESIRNTLNVLVDHFKDKKQFILLKSSSFIDTNNEDDKVNWTQSLYPLSLTELYPSKQSKRIESDIEDHLLFGMYPKIKSVKSREDKIELLQELYSNYLFKDIFEYQTMRKPALLTSLLKALALQIGKEVSYNDLAQNLDVDKNTIERYVDLLEKNFIIIKLKPFCKNPKKEISKLRKIYFVDLGIRNMVINDFRSFQDRTDLEQVWENFIFIERLKANSYTSKNPVYWFWREYQSRPVNLVEELDDTLSGFEFKWKSKRSKSPSGWSAYENSSFETITLSEIKEFIY